MFNDLSGACVVLSDVESNTDNAELVKLIQMCRAEVAKLNRHSLTSAQAKTLSDQITKLAASIQEHQQGDAEQFAAMQARVEALTASLKAYHVAMSTQKYSKTMFFRMGLPSVSERTKGGVRFEDFFDDQPYDFITCEWPQCFDSSNAMDKIMAYTSTGGYKLTGSNYHRPDFEFITMTDLKIILVHEKCIVNGEEMRATCVGLKPCSDGIIVQLSEEPSTPKE